MLASDIKRDTKNAVALGAAVAAQLDQTGIDSQTLDELLSMNGPKVEGWDAAVGLIDSAAEALDWAVASYPHPPQFWWEYDWYLTVDKVAEELIDHPDAPWSMTRIRACLVPL